MEDGQAKKWGFPLFLLMGDPRLATIRKFAEPILLAASAELVELDLRRQGGQLVVRFLVDKAGGVTVQDCGRLNQLISQALDAANCLEESYTLEVSSPGLDRPLVSRRDFERALGDDLEFHLIDTIRGARQINGRLLAVQEEAIVVATRLGNVTVPLNNIQHAKKAIRF